MPIPNPSQPLKLFLVLGPTCTGKTAVVNTLLERFAQAQVVCFDSCQIYDSFAIGTGRSDSHYPERLHLYGALSPAHELSVDDCMQLILAKAHEIIEQGGIPLLEGGSRRFMKALDKLYRKGMVDLDVIGIEPPSAEYMEQRYALRTDGFVDDGIFAEIETTITAGFGDSFLMSNYEVYGPFASVLDGGSLTVAKQQVIDRMREMHTDQLQQFKRLEYIRWHCVTDPDLLDLVSWKFEVYAASLH
jgi:tRNA A37 N6-isopentenylltransferase MiaA